MTMDVTLRTARWGSSGPLVVMVQDSEGDDARRCRPPVRLPGDDVDQRRGEQGQAIILPRTGAGANRGQAPAGSVRTARGAIGILTSVHGASPFAGSNPLQRTWRDCDTASRHAVLSPDIGAEVYGFALPGMDEWITPPHLGEGAAADEADAGTASAIELTHLFRHRRPVYSPANGSAGRS